MDQDINTLRDRLKEIEDRNKIKVSPFGPKRSFAGVLGSVSLRIVLLAGFTYLGLALVKDIMIKELGRGGFESRLEELAEGDHSAQIAAILLR